MCKERIRVNGCISLTRTQKRIVAQKYGKVYSNSIYYKLYAKYLKPGSDISDYIPDDFYMSKIEPYFNNPLIARKNEDKNLYDLFFEDIRMPQTIVRQIDGMFLDEKYHQLSCQAVVAKCKDCKTVIVKKASESGGGHGIDFWDSTESEEALLEKLNVSNNVIVQELVKQHPSMALLHKSSINTLRITTVIYENKVIVSSHFVRMGMGGKKVDNVSSGGMLCAVKSDGRLAEVGYDDLGRPYRIHPTSGAKFADCTIPNFSKCLAMCVDAAPRLSHVAKLISWDVAVGEDGEPILIEANLTYCDVGIYQIACGPILCDKNHRDKILKAIKSK